MKKIISLTAAVCCTVTLMSGCAKTELPAPTTEPETSTSETTIITEAPTTTIETTVPEIAGIPGKIYPMADETFEMKVEYQNEESLRTPLTDEDMEELTNKADRYIAYCKNTLSEDYDRTRLDFLTWLSPEECEKTIAELNFKGILLGCQIVHIVKMTETRADLVMMSHVERENGEVELHIGYLLFEKINGVWMLFNTDPHIIGPVDRYEVSRNEETNQIVLIDKGEDAT